MTNQPEAVALFFALSCFPVPLIVFPPEVHSWRTSPPILAGTRCVLLPALRERRAEIERLGFPVTVLPDLPSRQSAADASFLTMPGLVLFTSGSTGLPRPVYRPGTHLLGAAAALAAVLDFPPGSGVIGALPLARIHGMTHCLMVASVVGCRLALLECFDHKVMLRLFASQGYHYWPGTPVMADILSRCPLSGAVPAPAMCAFAGRLSASVCRAFEARFGVPLRQAYGTTETGAVTLDAAPASEVRSKTAGRALPGVKVCVGDDPRLPYPAGHRGRIWVSTPWWMDGYGVPPLLEPRESVDGWWPTPDIGDVDDAGSLTLVGRLDDCFKTLTGHLVNPAALASALDGYPAVTDVAVVPLETPSGPVLGVLLEASGELDPIEVRGHLVRSLALWSQPRVLETTAAIPRLPSGRIDRSACIRILAKSLPPRDATS